MAVGCERRDGDARGRDGSSVVCAKDESAESKRVHLGKEENLAREGRRKTRANGRAKDDDEKCDSEQTSWM
jgi:hypothetical protein